MTTSISGMPLRYLIGAEFGCQGWEGAFTVCPYGEKRVPKRGLAGAYINLYDQTGTDEYGPYRPNTDMANAYGERVPDPRGKGFWDLLRHQCQQAKDAGFKIAGDIDNRDAFPNSTVLEAYDVAQSFGLDIICKNPGTSDYEEDSTELLKHPSVIGAIVEQSEVTPSQLDKMRRDAGKAYLPVRFVTFTSNPEWRVWGNKMAAIISSCRFSDMGVTYSSFGEYGNALDILKPKL